MSAQPNFKQWLEDQFEMGFNVGFRDQERGLPRVNKGKGVLEMPTPSMAGYVAGWDTAADAQSEVLTGEIGAFEDGFMLGYMGDESPCTHAPDSGQGERWAEGWRQGAEQARDAGEDGGEERFHSAEELAGMPGMPATAAEVDRMAEDEDLEKRPRTDKGRDDE